MTASHPHGQVRIYVSQENLQSQRQCGFSPDSYTSKGALQILLSQISFPLNPLALFFPLLKTYSLLLLIIINACPEYLIKIPIFYLNNSFITPFSTSFILYIVSNTSNVSSRFFLALVHPFPSVNHTNLNPCIFLHSSAIIL